MEWENQSIFLYATNYTAVFGRGMIGVEVFVALDVDVENLRTYMEHNNEWLLRVVLDE